MTYDRSAVDEWIRVHRTLMEQEAEFTSLALRASRGELPDSELDEARARLLGMRELCNAIYSKAFPQAKGDHPPSA
jgi:hypothetical protein